MTRARNAIILLLVAAAAGAACLYAGYRFGEREAKRESADEIRRLSQLPEVAAGQPARWNVDNTTASATTTPPLAAPDEAAVEAPFAIDVSQPLRISWPLDIGRDTGVDRRDDRVCLRARQGANELQEPGTGWALYAFRLAKAGSFRSVFRVRFTDDRVGSSACNNSWFVAFDERPTEVIENHNDWPSADTGWHWERGPNVTLDAGLHWLRVELREDGPLMDRAALIGADASTEGPDDLPTVASVQPVGALVPFQPDAPVREVECFVLPTRSLAIGTGHVNEITVGAWHRGRADATFRGRIEVRCATAPALTIEGDPEIALGDRMPFAKRIVTLKFPSDVPRRAHHVVVTVIDEAAKVPVYREEVRFVRPYVWAFLGPLRGSLGRRGDNVGGDEAQVQPVMSCDANPMRIARRETPEALGLSRTDRSARWQVVDDGSCCDWTGAIDLGKVYGQRERTFAYAVTWLRAETRLQHRSFSFQADDAGWLWMAGRFVAVLPVDLPREANRLWSSAHLESGVNPVVVKLTQDRHYWGFRLDVVDWHWQGRRGDVVTGVEVAEWPGPRNEE